jgi:hypothetical protein
MHLPHEFEKNRLVWNVYHGNNGIHILILKFFIPFFEDFHNCTIGRHSIVVQVVLHYNSSWLNILTLL